MKAGIELNDSATTRTVLEIRDWDAQFEVNRTRDRKNTTWLAWSNRLDGDSYVDIVSHENGAAYLGVWAAILMIASRSRERGRLLRDDGEPHTATSISLISRMPLALVEEAVARFVTLRLMCERRSPARRSEVEPVIDPPQKVNGHAKPKAEEIAPPDDFDGFWTAWWSRWCETTEKNVSEDQAKSACRKVPPSERPQMVECSESYFLSREVEAGAVMNPAKFIRDQAKNGWKSRWPIAKSKQGESRIESNLSRMYEH